MLSCGTESYESFRLQSRSGSDGKEMRIHASHLGSVTPTGIFVSNDPALPPVIPPDLTPKVPVGYNPVTGTVDPTNTSGATTTAETTGPGSCASGMVWDPVNQVCFDCASIGQQLDPLHQVCIPVPSYTPVIIAGALMLAVFYVIYLVKG